MITPTELKKQREGRITAEVLLIEKKIIAANDSGAVKIIYHFSKNLSDKDVLSVLNVMQGAGYVTAYSRGSDRDGEYRYANIIWDI